MSKQIQLSIPKRCHERWDNMLPAEKGRFCGSCQKQVIDFTGMSDEQLALFFKKAATTGVCGRFMHHQLDRAIDIPKKRIPWVKYFFQFAFPAFLVSVKAAAQGTVTVVKEDVAVIDRPGIREADKAKAIPQEQITGKVTDKSGNGVPYASVIIKGSMVGTATDSTGNFALSFPRNVDSLVLISSSVGYLVTETVIDLGQIGQHVSISMDYSNTLPGVVVTAVDLSVLGGFVGGLVVEKVRFIDTIYNKLLDPKPVLKLYPNPLKRQSLLTIEIEERKRGSYSIQIATLTGQIIYTKEGWMEKNDRFINLDMPSVAAGTYLVSVINKQTGKAKTEKLIVE